MDWSLLKDGIVLFAMLGASLLFWMIVWVIVESIKDHLKKVWKED